MSSGSMMLSSVISTLLLSLSNSFCISIDSFLALFITSLSVFLFVSRKCVTDYSSIFIIIALHCQIIQCLICLSVDRLSFFIHLVVFLFLCIMSDSLVSSIFYFLFFLYQSVPQTKAGEGLEVQLSPHPYLQFPGKSEAPTLPSHCFQHVSSAPCWALPTQGERKQSGILVSLVSLHFPCLIVVQWVWRFISPIFLTWGQVDSKVVPSPNFQDIIQSHSYQLW